MSNLETTDTAGRAPRAWLHRFVRPSHGGYPGHVVIQRRRICPKCGGDGLEEIQSGPYFRKCALCNGTGYRPNDKLSHEEGEKTP